MVALSMADGYARLTGKLQCVIVHVDVGTQGLGAAVHNASCGRAPVLIFAGLSPFTIEGEMRGSRTEYIHWIQDVPDQKQIVNQYCRFTGEIKSGKNVKQIVNRAIQFAMSDPQGPVYVYGAREPMEEDLEPYKLDQGHWFPVEPAALPSAAVEQIAASLVEAKEPLVITGYAGRNAQAVAEFVTLADTVKGLRVLDTGGSDMCFPSDHPGWLGLRYGAEDAIKSADFILVVDCDVPWIPTQCKPRDDAKIVHIDVDPLKQQMPVFYIPAIARYRAGAAVSIKQVHEYLSAHKDLSTTLSSSDYTTRFERLSASHAERVAAMDKLAVEPTADAGSGEARINASYLGAQIRRAVPKDTIFAVEAVTLTIAIADQLRPIHPKSWINCGGGGLGWSGGGALGIKLATDTAAGGTNQGKFVTQVVGDGSYLFTVPGSVYWVSQRYKVPILTIVLNNKGWNAPRRSLLLVHPDGEGSKVSNEKLNISFAPTPDYAGIARAASGGEIWAGCAASVEALKKLLPEAVESVKKGVSAVLEVQIDGREGKWSGVKVETSSG